LSFKNGTWMMFSYFSLKLDPVTQIGINGFARLNGLYQFYEQSNYGGMGVNISRQFLQKKLTVSLTASDVFFTSNNSFTFQQGAFTAAGSRENDTRRIGLNVRYNFGARKKEEGQNPLNLESPEKAN
jgi:iron complex outermembrane recepter protein